MLHKLPAPLKGWATRPLQLPSSMAMQALLLPTALHHSDPSCTDAKALLWQRKSCRS